MRTLPLLAHGGPLLLLILAMLNTGCRIHKEGTASNPILSPSPPDSIYPSPSLFIANHSKFSHDHYLERIAEFKKDPLKPNDIVFIGNSITEQGGDWARRLQQPRIRNRGISGDVSEGVLRRLGEIGYYKPSAVFILIGINDLFLANTTPQAVADTILEIANTIHAWTPATNIYVQTILPTGSEGLIFKIKKTNDLLKAAQNPAVFTLLDTHAALANYEDLLRPPLTQDGVHLTEAGYQVWAQMLAKYVH